MLWGISITLLIATTSFATETAVKGPLELVLDEAANIFYIEVTLLSDAGYAEANVVTIIKGHYENEIWVVRRMHNGDMYPFTPGRRYVIFANRVMGDAYCPDYDDSLYAVRSVDLDGRLDLTPFDGFTQNATITLEEFVLFCASYLDPFKVEGTSE